MTDWNEDNFLEHLAPQLCKKDGRATGPCPDAETLLAVIEGAASEPERNTVNEHLSQCAACAELRSRLLNFESLSPPEPEAVWNQTETRLDNWLEGFLRSEALHTRAPKGSKSSQRVFGWESISNLFTPRKIIWASSGALALVLVLGVPLWLNYRRESLPRTQAGPAAIPPATANPAPLKGTEKPKGAPGEEGLRKAANKSPTDAEASNTPRVGEPGAPLAPAATAGADRNPPTETAEVRAAPAAPTPPNLPTLQLYPDGRVATIRTIGLTISYRLGGARTVESERNGRTIVSTGAHPGYVQRPYLSRNGSMYYLRTYVVGGHTYARIYRGYDYRGVRYYTYVPGYYYHPVFYGWAYNPWVSPVYYGPAAWGWVGTPWFGFYGGFFTPYPVYPTASLWLTDYLIASNLQTAYQAQAAANAEAAPAAAANAPPPAEGTAEASALTPLTPEIKQAIADEVQRHLAAERAAAAAPQQAARAPTAEQVPDALNPAERVFVVASNLDVAVQPSGQECGLTAGDVVMRLSDTPGADQNVTASIQSTKKADCPTGQTVAIGVQDLQEMHNRFREQIDSGLQMLAEKSGTDGLPKAPDTGIASGEIPEPAPDAGVANQLEALQMQADKAEYDTAERAESSGDLKAALALFQALAKEPGPMHAEAQVRAEQVTQLIANGNSSGCCASGAGAWQGTTGILTVRPGTASHPAAGVRAGRPALPNGTLTGRGGRASGVHASAGARPGTSARAAPTKASAPAAPRKAPPAPPK